jgi:putative hydrolase of the HAD superfamily
MTPADKSAKRAPSAQNVAAEPAAITVTPPGVARGLDHIDTWIFDLDNTLYPARCRLFDQVDRLIGRYIETQLGLDAVAARTLQKRYFREHGTTLSGLMRHHGVDPHKFLAFVHEIDLTPVEPSPSLAAGLARLPGRRLIYTNGSVAHAERVMEKLGVRGAFEGIFDIVAGEFRPKPEIASYRRLIERFRIDPTRAALIEDLPKNLIPAAELGMTTVLIATDSEWANEAAEGAHVHHRTEDLVAWIEAAVASLAARR